MPHLRILPCLTSTPNPSLFGQSVTIEAIVRPVAGGAVTGTVTFKDGSTDISGGGAVGTVGLGFPLIAGSEAHTCALQGGGGAKCWGLEGLLGDNSSFSTNTPVNVSGLAGAIAIGAGYLRTCALTDVGGVKCWGYNSSGELGDGTTTYRAVPVDVHGVGDAGLLGGISAIGVGYQHTCAVTDTGGVKCWGSNGGGQLGDGTFTNRSTPVEVVGVGGVDLLSDVKAVVGGYIHTCALTNAGGVKCWGSNSSFGQLGDGTFVSSLTPVNVSGLTSGVVAIGAGALHTCAVLSSGGVKCWGRGAEGQVGDNTFNSSNNVPLDVVGVGNVGLLSGISAVDLGYYHTCALASAGGVLCWGYNGDGELGDDGTNANSSTPLNVVSLSNASAIATGSYHSCAVTSAGVAKCWGRGNSGQLGNGATNPSDVPVDAAPLEALLFGRATFTTTALATGGRNITAEYSGDANHAASTSDTLMQVVDPHTTSTELEASVSPSVFGQPVTFTATVTSGGGTPTGTVTFFVNSVEEGTVALSVGGTAEYQTSSLAAGFAHGVVASYNGDSTHGTSSDFIPFHPVNKGATTTTVGAAPDPSTPSEQVTLTATVAVTSPAAGTPSGTVTFAIDDVDQTPVALSGSQAEFNTTALAVGSHTITAEYNGDASFNGSTSDDESQTVNLHSTSTTLGSSVNPSVSGQSVTFTATVAGGGTPTGTVTFTIDSVGQSPVALSSGSAELSTGALSVGAHTITAAYSGDATHAPSTSSQTTQTVNTGATSNTLGAAPNPSLFGQSATFTATVAATAPAGGTPSGTVTFKDGGSTIGNVALSAGTAVLQTAALATGAHSITATYEGSGNFAVSTSSAVTQTVNKGATTTTLSATPTSSLPGATVQLTATVGVTAPASGVPAGTVTFKAGSTTLGLRNLVAGAATLSTATLPIGTNQLTAVYSGNANFVASTSAVRPFVVSPRVGAEFRINTHGTTIAHLKQFSAVARLAGNAFAVAWESKDQDASSFGIYDQRYTAAGVKSGVEFRANTAIVSAQQQPSVAGLTNGFVVVWASLNQDGSGWGVFGQRYNSVGVKLGLEFRVNTATSNHQWQPSVAGLKAGGFVVTWASNLQDGSGYGVFGQRYNAAGVKTGVEFRVSTKIANNQWTPHVASLENGGFVVIWSSNDQAAFGHDIYGQAYTSVGVKAGAEFLVNTVRTKDQSEPSVAGLKDGGFAVVWTSKDQDGSGLGVYGQRYNAGRAKAGIQFPVNTVVANNQSQPSVAGFLDRGFVVVWTSQNQDGSGKGVYGQAYNAAGVRVQPEFRINTTTLTDQWQAQVAAFSAGDFVAAWSSKNAANAVPGVYGQRLRIGGL